MATVTPGIVWTSGETVTPTKLNAAAAPTVAVDPNEITTAKIADGAVTNQKLASGIDAAKITTGTLPVAQIADGAIVTGKLADASSTTTGVTNSKLRHSDGLSVIGRSNNTTGAPADIVAATDGHILRRSGTSIGFGTLPAGAIGDGSISAAKLDGVAKNSAGTNLSVGTAPVFGCRAFVNCNFNGVISAAGNVTSVTKPSTGSFTVNFTTSMPDANYAVSAMATYNGGNIYHARVTNASTSSCTVRFEHILGALNKDSTNVAAINPSTVYIAFFR
jgi:hypothetical protein